MAQTHEQLIDRLNSVTFCKQIEYSVDFLIRWVKEESAEVQYHAQCLEWANAAMANPTMMANSMAPFVITDGSCNGDITPTDAQVRSAVEALINTDKWMLA
jgi:hypothetical protein